MRFLFRSYTYMDAGERIFGGMGEGKSVGPRRFPPSSTEWNLPQPRRNLPRRWAPGLSRLTRMADAGGQAGAETKRGFGGWARLIGGWALVVVGVLGFVLPIIPGLPLLLGGLALLAKDYPCAQKAQEKVKKWIAKIRQRFR